MSTINLISPTTFTTAVLVGDATDTGGTPTLTEVNQTPVSVALEVQSTKGGFLLPRMTTAQRDAMSAGTKEIDNGLLIYNATDNTVNVYQNKNWEALETAGNGFVVGPNASVIDNIAVFNNVDGDLIADSGIKAYQNNGNFFVATPASGADLTIGAGNVGIGGNNLSSVTSGSFNVSLGDGNLLFLTTGDENTAIGTLSLENCVAGNSNTSVGYRSLQKSDSTGNTAIGAFSINSTTTGIFNTAVGVSSLKQNIAGTGNCAFGTGSLENSKVDNSVAIGYNSLNQNTTGTLNTSVGSSALALNTTGSSNTAVGNNALTQNLTGGTNTAVGALAALVTSTGNSNVAIGASSCKANTTGSFNIGIGYESNLTTVNADGNIGIGYRSLNGLNINGGNVALGSQSGQLADAEFQNCTFIGNLASSLNANLNNATAIGANTGVNSNNSINLGNGCNVGINNPTPTYNLDIGLIGNYCGIKMAPTVDVPDAPGYPATGGYLYISAAGNLHFRGTANDTLIANA